MTSTRYVEKKSISLCIEMEKEKARHERDRTAKLREAAERMADGLAFAEKRSSDEFPDEAAEGL